MASLAKWLSVCLRTKWLWVWVPLLLLNGFSSVRKFQKRYVFKRGSLTNTNIVNGPYVFLSNVSLKKFLFSRVFSFFNNNNNNNQLPNHLVTVPSKLNSLSKKRFSTVLLPIQNAIYLLRLVKYSRPTVFSLITFLLGTLGKYLTNCHP